MIEQFTPGPWTVDDHEIGAVMSGNICVSRGKDAGCSLGEIEANARLIAAAPQMLNALKAASHALRSYQHGNADGSLALSVADHADSILALTCGGQP